MLVSFIVAFSQTSTPLAKEQKIAQNNLTVLSEPAIVPFEKSNYDSAIRNRNSVVEIGTGTGEGPFPAFYADWANHWENCRTQTLFFASELGGGPMLITDLQYSFARVAPVPDNWVANVEIRIIETKYTQLTRGMFYDTSGATLVYSSANYIPAPDTGWGNMIDIIDYPYTGNNNLIIDVLWGDNGYWKDVNYYKTRKTQGGATRMLFGYGDSRTPPLYSDGSIWFSNIRFYWDSLAVGDLVGTVTSNGVPVWDATVGVGITTVTSDYYGEYILSGLLPGDNDVFCIKDHYNYVINTGTVIADTQTVLDIDLSPPSLVIDPSFILDTLAPEEVFTDSIDVKDMGNGNLCWKAEIVYPDKGNYIVNNLSERKKELLSMSQFSAPCDFSSVATKENDSLRSVNFPCPYGTIWSNPLVGSNNAFASHALTATVVQEFNGIPSPFCTITVYGIYVSSPPIDPMDFIVDFYADGAVPGELMSSSTTTANYVETGEILTYSYPMLSYPVFSYTLDIPTNNMTDGYISVIAQLGTDWWYWNNTYEGTGNALYQKYCSWTSIQTRAICFGDGSGRWLTLSDYDGNVPSNGGVQTIGATINAEGTQIGEVYTANIIFSAYPSISQTTVPVTMVIGINTDITNFAAEESISLYPNPASDMVTISSEIPMTRLTITNYIGQVIYTNAMSKETRVVLNTSSYDAGVYIVKIDTGNGVVTKQILISR